MNDPRYFKESSGDHFFGTSKAILLSLVLHVLVLWALDASRPLQPEGGRKLSVVIAEPRPSPRVGSDSGMRAATSQPPLVQRPGGVRGGNRGDVIVGSGGVKNARDLPVLPPGEDLSAYRLALGRAFGNLLDENVRSALPSGEIRFLISYPAGSLHPSIRLSPMSDQVIATCLHETLVRALTLVPFPASWRSGRYQLELRAQVVGT